MMQAQNLTVISNDCTHVKYAGKAVANKYLSL